ncbi:hypothetical protein ACJ41O_001808 [Fusarium nematophilum]
MTSLSHSQSAGLKIYTMLILDWQKTVAEKRRQRDEAILRFVEAELTAPENTNGDGPKRDAITEIDDAVLLASKIASGKLTSVAVTKAYIARLTEVFFDEALTRAKKLDEAFTQEGRAVGAFHGVPVTLKDQFNVKGHDTTLGYTGRAFRPAEDDAVLVKMLKDLGAWCETENPLWGLTDNPMIEGYTPGGSTGGESALLYMQGSLLGWGTDIGGSIRIPSHMLGLYGLKPKGQEHVPSSIGPLARSLSTIYQVTKELVLQEPWTKDSRCILYDDGVVKPHPAVTRVVQEAAAALSSNGHELLSWNADLHAECIEVMDLFYTVDGGEDVRRAVAEGGEPFIPHVEKLINRGKPISVFEYWQLNKRKRALQQAYLEKWNSILSPTGKPVDALIMPVMPHAAVPHRATRWVGYTKVWNFLDYTALVVPAGKVEERDCEVTWDEKPRNEMDGWNKKVWEENRGDMAGRSLPLGVQIVGRGLEEEKVLAIGRVLEEAMTRGG